MIHIYTGSGKGKTTASLGLVLRASASKKALFTQFIKDGKSSEVEVLRKLANVDYKAFGEGRRIFPDKPNLTEKENIKKGLDYIKVNAKKFQMIVMDEIITAVNLKLITEKDLLDCLDHLPKEAEIILTGHSATKKLITRADLVTEMKMVKHYYDKGIKAREGIEF